MGHLPEPFSQKEPFTTLPELGGIQVDSDKYPTLQRNAAQVKGNQQILPKPVIVKVAANGRPARQLLDSGSLGDFIPSTLADHLAVRHADLLDQPLSLQLAVQGSRTKVNTLNIINITNHDLILSTPLMYPWGLSLSFNPARVVIGSDDARPLRSSPDTNLMVHSMSIEEHAIQRARDEPRKYAKPLCKEMHETELPPLRAINHTIPLIDESQTYH